MARHTFDFLGESYEMHVHRILIVEAFGGFFVVAGVFKMFDGRTLLGLMQPGKHLRDAFAAETQIYTLKTPPKFFGKGVRS